MRTQPAAHAPTLTSVDLFVRERRADGATIVLTGGVFDLLHLGHIRYLNAAAAYGDLLVVGVEDDALIRARKGKGRPIVPERERLALVSWQRAVDLVYLKRAGDDRWGLVRTVRPDVLVISADHPYSPIELAALGELCRRVVVLERQSEVTTTTRVRDIARAGV